MGNYFIKLKSIESGPIDFFQILVSANSKLSFIFLFGAMMMSCVNPIHVSRGQLRETLNSEIGNDFSSRYPNVSKQDLLSETSKQKEYIFGKYDACAWAVKVDKDTNFIESWRFVNPDKCLDD